MCQGGKIIVGIIIGSILLGYRGCCMALDKDNGPRRGRLEYIPRVPARSSLETCVSCTMVSLSPTAF